MTNNIRNELARYLNHDEIKQDSVSFLWFDYMGDNGCGDQHELNPIIDKIQDALNRDELDVDVISGLYYLYINTFPEGLWFLLAMLRHDSINSQKYVDKLIDNNFISDDICLNAYYDVLEYHNIIPKSLRSQMPCSISGVYIDNVYIE